MGSTSARVFQKDGHSTNAPDFGPRNTNNRCMISRPKFLQTIWWSEGNSVAVDACGLIASSICQAAYSNPWRRESARLPHGRPLSSTNHTRPPASRRSSIMNIPRHPALLTISAAFSLISGGTDFETQALDPDPWGFIILSLRCPLQPSTSSGPANPNTPSPVPTIKGWTKTGVRSPHAATARSNSPRFAQIHFGQSNIRFPEIETQSAAFRITGKGVVSQNSKISFADLAMPVAGTSNPASRAAWIWMHFRKANSALGPRGPANTQPSRNSILLPNQTALSSNGNKSRGVDPFSALSEEHRSRISAKAAFRSDSGGESS